VNLQSLSHRATISRRQDKTELNVRKTKAGKEW
jgi:hypothetical protein